MASTTATATAGVAGAAAARRGMLVLLDMNGTLLYRAKQRLHYAQTKQPPFPGYVA